MPRGNTVRIDPFYSSGPIDFLPLAKPPTGPTPSTSTIFPYLRKVDIRDDFLSTKHHKNALLTLKLSSTSFLDSTVNDGLSDNALYTIKTTSTCTTVLRNDPWEGTNKVADIRWAKRSAIKGKGREGLQGSVVEMIGGRTKPAEQFLKLGALSGTRSFVLPSYPHPFKWKRSGAAYHCTTSSVKGPVATMDAAVSSVPPRIHVFESLIVQDTRPQLDRGGVSLNLLDHLLITALLLVTDPEEWITHARPNSISMTRSESSMKSAPSPVRQWRKIVYGNPPFPSLRSARHRSADDSDPDDDLRPSSPAQRPASMRQLRKIVFGEPMFPSLGRPGPDPVDDLEFATRCSTPDDYDCGGSISSDDMNDPVTPASISSAPAHGFLDPSFYDSNLTVPPVPEVPVEYQSPSPDLSMRQLPPTPSTTATSFTPSTATPSLTSSTSIRRELPRPPVASTSYHHLATPYSPTQKPEPSWLHRSQSTPFLYGSGSPAPSSVRPLTRPPSSPNTYPSAFTDLPRSTTRVRQLPQPPTLLTPSTSLSRPVRPLRPTVVTRSRSEKSRPSSAVPSLQPSIQRSLPETPEAGSSSGGRLSAHEQFIQQSIAKEASELADWMGSLVLTGSESSGGHSEHPDEIVDASRNVVFDPPPPAYNAIDFSHPPHASAPPSTSPTPPPTR